MVLQKQQVEAMSTADKEYISIVMELQHDTFLKRMIEFLPIRPTEMKTNALTDNIPPLGMIFSLAGTKMSKFIDLRQNFIKD